MKERSQGTSDRHTEQISIKADAQSSEKTTRGLEIPRYFTSPGKHPFDCIEWEQRVASLSNEKGEVIFEQEGVEVPKAWSQMATNVVASKYFFGPLGGGTREHSIKQLIERVSKTIAQWGLELGYFASPDDAENFDMELTHILVNQYASFNSPVWFNLGIEEKPQCSACFINSVEDSMESILELSKTEGMLFKYGSGTGTNLSPIRSSKEQLSTGGSASGPVSFMKGYDAFAGVIKSGGKTRRAAKMVILNADHPDIAEFIQIKVKEEKKAWTLIDAGYDGSLNGEAYNSVFFQNSNNSVRVSDDFMRAVENDGLWQTRAVTSGEPLDSYRARDIMRMVAEATWQCGDPGMQFHSTINDWHTCKATEDIHASNPCSEFMFLNDSACNLSSLNLMKFTDVDARFDVDAFRKAVQILITAQEILVDNAGYPTDRIAQTSYDFRPLGLGYANLGALLMASGMPYDSDGGRALAAAVTAVMTGQAYATSAEIARTVGPFKGFAANRDCMSKVIRKHQDALRSINPDLVPANLLKCARRAWEEAVDIGDQYGYRNAQVSVLAPTGTIAFMMDCDTTGIEPDLALIKYKKLVGGGLLKIVNQSVPSTLVHLGYKEKEVEEMVSYLRETETIEGAPHIKDEHLPIFDCAFRPLNGERYISHMGHIRMMAAAQPFISGAISKTVNVPSDVTEEEIADIYLKAWKFGLKAVAIYRDGSKRIQPLSQGEKDEPDEDLSKRQPVRRRLPEERQSITHKFVIGDHEGYMTVGLYPDGKPGEIFLVMAKEGTVVSGLCDCFATAISLALQYGVPLEVLIDKFIHTRFEPSGFTHHPEIRFAKSIADYLFQWMKHKFPESGDDDLGDMAAVSPAAAPQMGSRDEMRGSQEKLLTFRNDEDAPPCPECGSLMTRNGSCYRCINCGATNGCS
jgi:ribonucleoside-diphosphate reductase alpha chain